jgi:hypothetical protein
MLAIGTARAFSLWVKARRNLAAAPRSEGRHTNYFEK